MKKRRGKRKVQKKPVRVPQKKRKPWVLDEGVRQMIREEAEKLKLSEEEYLRLMTHFSEVVRTSILPAGVLDGGFLTMILQNPMVLEMLKGMIRNAISGAMNKSKSVSSDVRSGLPDGGTWSNGRQGQQAPQYGPRPGLPAAPQMPRMPQGHGGPQGYGGPQGFGGVPGHPGMWGMPEGQQQQQQPLREEAPEVDVEQEPAQENEESGEGALDLDAIARMVGQFLQK